MGRFFRGILGFLIGLYGVATIIGLAFVLVDQTDFALWEFAKSAVLLTLAVSPFMLLLALMLRRAWLAALVLPAVVGFLVYFIPYYLPKEKMPPADSHVVRVMTYNVLVQSLHSPIIANHIRSSGADIVALQELSDLQAAYIEENLSDLYPYMALHGQSGDFNWFRGQGVLSRYPIVNDEYWLYEDLPETHGHQRVEIDIDGQTVVVYNTHPWPAIDWNGGLNFSVSEANDRSHSEALDRLWARVTQETQPLLWVGDFNMSDQFEEYARITSRFTDSWREVGQGMGYTYPEDQPPFPELIRLDYVFHNEAFQGVSGFIMPTTRTSDHRGLVMTLALLSPSESSP